MAEKTLDELAVEIRKLTDGHTESVLKQFKLLAEVVVFSDEVIDLLEDDAEEVGKHFKANHELSFTEAAWLYVLGKIWQVDHLTYIQGCEDFREADDEKGLAKHTREWHNFMTSLDLIHALAKTEQIERILKEKNKR